MGKRDSDNAGSIVLGALVALVVGLFVLKVVGTIVLCAAPVCVLATLILGNRVDIRLGLPLAVQTKNVWAVVSVITFCLAAVLNGYGDFVTGSEATYHNLSYGLGALSGLFLAPWCVGRDSEIQRRLAGIEAESQVAAALDRFKSTVGAQVCHGALFVFKQGTPDEYSAELDHVLVTKRNIYVIETKYKSGAIHAEEDAPRWVVETEKSTGDMRNGLIQAKNSIATMRNSVVALKSERLVPIVVLVGNNTEIIDGPTNVVVLPNLEMVISAFEAKTKGADINVASVMAILQSHISNDTQARLQHVARIQSQEKARQVVEQKRQEHELADLIVSHASTASPNHRKTISAATPDDSMEQSSKGIMYVGEPARHGFDALVGMQDLKDQLLEAGLAAGLSQGVTVEGVCEEVDGHETRNGVLLYGDPGNGKTFIVEGLAGELGVPIIRMSFGSVASKFINQTTEQVVRLFNDARKQAPCVLFMDEVDSVICNRDFVSSTTEEGPKITNQVLTELVNTRGTGVLVVMATNYFERLDSAAIREGRVDFKIEVPPPDALARAALISGRINRAAKGLKISNSTCDLAAKRFEGFSASRIVSVADECTRKVVRENRREVSFDDLQAAMKKIQGALGDRLSEDTPLLGELHMSDTQSKCFAGVAKRMTGIERVEAMGGSVPTGILLAGPPGTGKTLAVRSLAKTTAWPLISAVGADLLSDTKKIDTLIKRAHNARPCIVFIDEADDVFANRRRLDTFSASITNKLLTTIDGVGGKPHGVLWVIAVNDPDSLDPAALRGGRFTEKIWFDNPSADVSARIIAQWLEKTSARFDSALTPETLASALDGASPANITAILQQAVNHMIARSDDSDYSTVHLEDVASAKRIILGTVSV